MAMEDAEGAGGGRRGIGGIGHLGEVGDLGQSRKELVGRPVGVDQAMEGDRVELLGGEGRSEEAVLWTRRAGVEPVDVVAMLEARRPAGGARR